MLTTIKSVFASEPQKPTLAELLASWPSTATPPRFLGKPKKDLPIDIWLGKITEACIAQKVPKTLWHEVARHFMGEEARKRLEEVEQVMQHVCGHRWGWGWSSFVVALKHMGWSIDPKKTETVRVHQKASGTWWIVGRGGDKGTKVKTKEPLPEPGFLARAAQRVSSRSMTAASLPKKVVVKRTKTIKILKSIPKQRARTSVLSRTLSRISVPLHLAAPPPPPPTTITAQVPFWLLAASEALFTFTGEHSNTMSVLAAVLITVGSIPSLPAVTAGTTAHALGSIAIGLGTLLRERACADAKK